MTRVDRDRVSKATDEYMAANSHLAETAVEKTHVEMVCLVLAANDYLNEEGIAVNVAEEILADALLTPGRGIIRWTTRIMLALSRDPMNTLVRYSSERIPPAYGSLFSFEEEHGETDAYTMRVTRCFYHGFLSRHGAPHRTRIFCRWDEAWIQPISEARHGVKFSRPETIADGGQSCPFIFRRAENHTKDR